MIDALPEHGRPGRAGAGRAARAAGGRPAHPRRPAVRLRLRPGAWPAWTSWPRAAYALVGARQRARPDRVPVPAGDGERAGRRGGQAARRRRPADGRQRHQRRHRVADPGGQGGPRRPARTSPRPRLVMPATAHAAFAKAAHYLRVALDAGAGRPGPARRPGRRWPPRSARTPCWWPCSAPSYAHGVVDPVAEIAAVGRRARRAVPRGRLLRRLGAAVPAAARRRPARRSTSPCPASPASRSTCTSTRTRRRASRCCCTATRRCGGRSTSRTPTGPATRWSTRSSRPPGPAARSPPPWPRCGTSATPATCGWPRRTRDAVAGAGRRGRGGRRAAAARRRPRPPWSAWPRDPGVDLFVLADELAAAAGTPSRSSRTGTCRRPST